MLNYDWTFPNKENKQTNTHTKKVNRDCHSIFICHSFLPYSNFISKHCSLIITISLHSVLQVFHSQSQKSHKRVK